MLGIDFIQHAEPHLRVRRNARQRRVHFVSDTRGKQTNGREFLALLQLLFERDSRRNVFEHDQCSSLALAVLQRSERDIQNQPTVPARGGVELVNVADLFEAPSVFTEHLLECVGKILREQFLHEAADSRVATKIEHVFKGRVQAGDASIQIDGQQTDVDRFNDRLVELLEKLQLAGTLLLIFVEQAVFDRDGDVSRDSAQNLNVFGRKQRAIYRTAETNHRNHPSTNNTGNKIV